MVDPRWTCIRQRAGPLVKECRAIRPRLYEGDDPEDLKEKRQILRSSRTALDRTSVDRLEFRVALFGYEGSHYTLTFDPEHLPGKFDGVKGARRNFIKCARSWHGGQPFDYISCIEGRHGDHRYHIHLILRDSDFSPAEVRHLWKYGEVDDEPVLRKEGGYRRLAKYFNKEAPDGFMIPIGRHPWSCSRGLGQRVEQAEKWYDGSGRIEIPDGIIWARRGGVENDFGAYRYGSYILKKEEVLYI